MDTLSTLNIHVKESQPWQTLARVDEKLLDAHISSFDGPPATRGAPSIHPDRENALTAILRRLFRLNPYEIMK